MNLKSREFFIPSTEHCYLSKLLFSERMQWERNNVIRIGMKPDHGGMYELALFLNYKSDEIFWFDGDIEGLDKKIKDWQLYLYIATGTRYFNFKKMNQSQKKFIRDLVKKLMYHISTKVVLCAGTFWRIMKGLMYSGGTETSHGDSWVMLLAFCLYITHTMTVHYTLADVIMLMVKQRYLGIVVYGDDHIICCPKFLRSIINVNSFATFLAEYMDMILRDFKEYDVFLSVPDYHTGGLRYAGPKFLKKFFIKNTINTVDLAPVLPYVPLMEPMVKLFCDSEAYPEKYILKSISAAWHTYGTNYFHYELILHFYEYMMMGRVRTPYQMYLDAVNSVDGRLTINKMIRRCAMTAEQLFNHFPTMKELLGRHVYEKNKCAYGNKGDWLFALQVEMDGINIVQVEKDILLGPVK